MYKWDNRAWARCHHGYCTDCRKKRGRNRGNRRDRRVARMIARADARRENSA